MRRSPYAMAPARPSVGAPHRLAHSALLLVLVLCACAPPAPPATHPTVRAGNLDRIEQHYQRLRFWDDQRRLMGSLGQDTTPAGVSRAVVADSLQIERAALRDDLVAPPAPSAGSDDALALAVMEEEWNDGLAGGAGDAGAEIGTATGPLACDSALTGTGASPDPLETLTQRVFACFGGAATRIIVDTDTLNRLALLGELSREASPLRRRQLFLALAPVWRSVNGDNSRDSPYRTLLALRRAAWGDSASPIARKAPAFGLTSIAMEQWLTRALTAWRDATPDSLLEPWDWYYSVGEASRRLSAHLPGVSDIRRVNDRYYASIGADPARLHVGYDLLARPGKYPVAYTDIGARGQWNGAAFSPSEPWIFTAYLTGGFDNLAELMHESGHAIHVAGIRTRPALLDWPDNDTFTEALADVPALELYEPAWQQRFLGDSVTTAASLRAKYAGIVFDIAWALFELRVHTRPNADPNAIWSAIASDYLHIRAHPEWSWWAIRGQLIDAPGYLVNYALGAFMAADIRSRVIAERGPFSSAGTSLYPWLSREIYRFGRERTSRAVLEAFLDRPLRADALLTDLARMEQ